MTYVVRNYDVETHGYIDHIDTHIEEKIKLPNTHLFYLFFIFFYAIIRTTFKTIRDPF